MSAEVEKSDHNIAVIIGVAVFLCIGVFSYIMVQYRQSTPTQNTSNTQVTENHDQEEKMYIRMQSLESDLMNRDWKEKQAEKEAAQRELEELYTHFAVEDRKVDTSITIK